MLTPAFQFTAPFFLYRTTIWQVQQVQNIMTTMMTDPATSPACCSAHLQRSGSMGGKPSHALERHYVSGARSGLGARPPAKERRNERHVQVVWVEARSISLGLVRVLRAHMRGASYARCPTTTEPQPGRHSTRVERLSRHGEDGGAHHRVPEGEDRDQAALRPRLPTCYSNTVTRPVQQPLSGGQPVNPLSYAHLHAR